MNSKARGASLERRFIQLLETHGYKCEKARATYAPRMAGRPMAVAHDLFRCLDIVAKKRGQKTAWVQVTTQGSSIKGKADKFRAEAEAHFDPDFDEVVVAQWVKPEKPGQRGQWRITRWCDDFDPRSSVFISSQPDSLPWEAP